VFRGPAPLTSCPPTWCRVLDQIEASRRRTRPNIVIGDALWFLAGVIGGFALTWWGLR
jgi:hypothetical protein